MKYAKNTSGFTLVEMVLATTIFAVMSIAVISVYIQVTDLSYRLKATRYLSETAREITEKIAEDIRERGLTGTLRLQGSRYWDGGSGYSQSGAEILGIGDGSIVYLYGKKSPTAPYIVPCDDILKNDITVHCGLYRIMGTDYLGSLNLVDSFIPEEEKKRVKILDLKFFVSGDGKNTENKVTIVFTLGLMPRIGVPNARTNDNTLRIQTTLSEKFYK